MPLVSIFFQDCLVAVCAVACTARSCRSSVFDRLEVYFSACIAMQLYKSMIVDI